LFREYIVGCMADPPELASLRAETMAAAVVAAHNHVLRRWLRGECDDPVQEVHAAMQHVIGLFAAPGVPAGAEASGTTIVAFRTPQDIDTLLPVLRHLVEKTTE
jgi:hypothetical protein